MKQLIKNKMKSTHKRPSIRKSESTNSPKKNETLEEMKKGLIKLNKEIATVEDTILNDDDDHEESPWRLMKKGLEDQAIELDEKIRKESLKLVDNFVQRASSNRIRSNKDTRKVFGLAKRDAEDRVFSIVVMSDNDIAQCFSTNSFFIDPTKGPVRPPKFNYSWYHDLKRRENNLIPLSPGIEVPKKRDPKSGEVKDINFMVSFFYSDKRFLERCKEYYRSYGLSLDISKDKKIRHKWWIKLCVDNEEGKILFREEDDPYSLENTYVE